MPYAAPAPVPSMNEVAAAAAATAAAVAWRFCRCLANSRRSASPDEGDHQRSSEAIRGKSEANQRHSELETKRPTRGALNLIDGRLVHLRA